VFRIKQGERDFPVIQNTCDARTMAEAYALIIPFGTRDAKAVNGWSPAGNLRGGVRRLERADAEQFGDRKLGEGRMTVDAR
jgi:hypothetical protein